MQKFQRVIGGMTVTAGVAATLWLAAPARAVTGPIGDVFVIALENHNWIQPNGNVGALSSIQQIKGNPNAPFINSLVNGTSPISSQVSYTDSYHNVLATPVGPPVGPSIHPSEPNYFWAEAGTNFGVADDNDPYGSGGHSQNTKQHLTAGLNNNGTTWRFYQEGVDLVPTSGGVNNPGSNALTNTVATPSQRTSPIKSFSGTSANYTNQYNGSHQYNYAAKHNPMILFNDTNGGNDLTTSNPAAKYYAPMEQLSSDLAANTVARYNWITPDQFNDMHTALSGGYNPLDTVTGLHDGLNGFAHVSGDAANIRQGDDFLKQVIPMIMASAAYQNNGTIIIWDDESEPQGNTPNEDQNDFSHSIPFIVISPLAKGNDFDSSFNYTHSSMLLTLEELFNTGYYGDSVNSNDLRDLFVDGAIPTPEPASSGLVGLAVLALAVGCLRRGARTIQS